MLTEFEVKRVKKVVDVYIQKRRPPVHIRPKLDLGFRVLDQSIEIFEIRPVWNGPGSTLEQPVAKATYVKTQGYWKVFWMRADLKWHSYSPSPIVRTVEEFLELVEADSHVCFWG